VTVGHRKKRILIDKRKGFETMEAKNLLVFGTKSFGTK
jgi:hypothetical protein